jgi:hypothetical protein
MAHDEGGARSPPLPPRYVCRSADHRELAELLETALRGERVLAALAFLSGGNPTHNDGAPRAAWGWDCYWVLLLGSERRACWCSRLPGAVAVRLRGDAAVYPPVVRNT